MTIADDTTYKIDFRKRHCETRQVRDGDALLFQYKNSTEEIDGSMTTDGWVTTGSIPNYAQCMEPKLSWWQRIFS